MPSPALRGGAALAAVLSAAAFASPAHAATTTFPSNASVDASSTGWTGQSSCGLLCAAGTDWSATGGTSNTGRLGTSYATLLGLLNLQAGGSTWTSDAFE